jgi:WD40 repeat protein
MAPAGVGSRRIEDYVCRQIIERPPLEGVNGLTLSPDGKMLFTLDRHGKLRIEEVATGTELLRPQFPGDVMAHLAISPDGSMLALGSGPNTHKIFLWKWQAAEEPREISSAWQRGRELVFSPDGKLLAECSGSEPDARPRGSERPAAAQVGAT